MNRKISLLVLGVCVLIINMQSQSYQPMLKAGNKWNVLYESMTTCGCGESKTYSLTLAGDTVIDLQTYKKLMCKLTYAKYYSVYEATFYTAALREDTVKQAVYVRYPEKDEELLYNFNLKKGDTLEIKDVYKDTWSDSKTICKVKNVEQYTMGGFSGRKISVCDSVFTNQSGSNWPYHWSINTEKNSDEWYEGMGSIKSLVKLDYSAYPAYYDAFHLLCFWNNDTQIYHYERHSDCVIALWSGLNDVSEKNKIVNSNAINKKLSIDSNELSKSAILELFDSRGILISKSTLAPDNNTIDLSRLNKGLYIYKLLDNGKIIETGKFITQ